MSRNTVNGIKVKKVDEKTRKQIERAGDIAAQVCKAAELNVLDTKHYDEVIRGLNQTPKFRKMILLISMYCIYGFSLLTLGNYALYMVL